MRPPIDMTSQGLTFAEGPHVSVLIIACNVDKYIEKALASVLMQQVDFSYEIVVGEDCSTDRTRDILISHARRHEDVIRLILRDKNLGMNRNFFSTYAECRGKYIALLDGDDYWTSPDKLQKQVDFLETHPDYSICFHNALVVYEDDSEPSHPFHTREPKQRLSRPIPKETSTLEDLLGGNFMQTGSVVFRADFMENIPEWFSKMPTFDWPLHVYNAKKGRIQYLDEIMSAYRVHDRGMWSMNMSFFRSVEDVDHMLEAYGFLDRHLEGQYHEFMHVSSRWLFEIAAQLLYSDGKIDEGNKYVMRYLKELPLRRRLKERRLLSSMLHANYPTLANLLDRTRSAFAVLAK